MQTTHTQAKIKEYRIELFINNNTKWLFDWGYVLTEFMMYTLLYGLYKHIIQKDEFCVLILGLDNAGKTVR